MDRQYNDRAKMENKRNNRRRHNTKQKTKDLENESLTNILPDNMQ